MICDKKKYDRTYGSFAIERKEIQKKINFIFICQKCFKYYNLFRFYINLFFIFFGVSFLSIAKLPYIIFIELYIFFMIILYGSFAIEREETPKKIKNKLI